MATPLIKFTKEHFESSFGQGYMEYIDFAHGFRLEYSTTEHFEQAWYLRNDQYGNVLDDYEMQLTSVELHCESSMFPIEDAHELIEIPEEMIAVYEHYIVNAYAESFEVDKDKIHLIWL